MRSHYWQLEFRNGATQVECRLRGGMGSEHAEGEKAWERTGDFAPFGDADGRQVSEVLRLSDALTCDATLDAAAAVAQAILQALPPSIRDILERWAGLEFPAPRGLRHPLLQVVGVDSEHPGAAKDLVVRGAFEALAPVRRGQIGLRRCLPLQPPAPAELGLPARPANPNSAPPPEHRALRVLFVVGSLRDGGSNVLVDAALRTFHKLIGDTCMAGVGAALDVTLVCAKAVADSWRKRGHVADSPRPPIAKTLQRLGELQDVLQHGIDGRPGERPYDVLVLLGHSDGNRLQAAAHLCVDFVAEAPEHDKIPIQELAPFLPPTLRAIVLLNCRSADYAVDFLPFADFVVGARPMLHADTAEHACGALFRSLLVDDRSPSEAVRCMRESMAPDGWQIVQLSRVLHDEAFHSRFRQIVQQHYHDDYKPQRLLRPSHNLGGNLPEVTLSQIHVTLELELGRFRRETTAGNSVETRSERRSVTFAELLDLPHRRWVVRGEPGIGKTTTLRVCALDWPSGRFVLYVPLAKYAALLPPEPNGQALCRVVRDRRGLEGEFAEVVQHRAATRSLIVLLDGYDEVAGADRPRVDKLLAWFGANWPEAVVVVTMRMGTKVPFAEADSREGLDPLHWQPAAIQPLGEEAQRELLRNWFAAMRPDATGLAEAVVEQIERSGARMRDLAGNPLLLTVLADAVVAKLKAGASATDLGWLAQLRRRELLQGAITACLAGEYAEGTQRQHRVFTRSVQKQCRMLLRRVAWNMTTAGLVEIDEATLRAWLFPRRRGATPALHEDGCDAASLLTGDWDERTFLTDMRSLLGVLRPEDGGVDARWRFAHRHFQEVLAAEYWWHVRLDSVAEQDVEPAVLGELQSQLAAQAQRAAAALDADEDVDLDADRDARDTDFWTEPLVLLAESSSVDSWLPRGDRLLVPLLREKATRPLGIRVLMALDEVQPETVRELLVADPRSAIGSAALPAWGDEFEDLPPFGGWRPRALVLELLGERLERDAKQAHAVMAPLLERAKQPDVPFAEIGAIVWCLERAGQRWWPRDAFARWQRLPLSSRVRCWPKVVREAVDGILAQPCFGRLADADVAEHFARTPVPRGADEPRRRQGQRTLWPLIPAVDDFEMGSHDYEGETPPAPKVKLAAYRCQATHVTNGQWRRFRSEHPADRPWQPVVSVQWYEGLLFARWLTRQRQQLAGAAWGVEVDAVFDLPTEAESERAIRGGTNTKYWSGNDEADLARVAWYSGNSDSLHDVAELVANAFGIHDAHGNAWIWALDAYQRRLMGGDSPVALRSGAPRVLRGGCRMSVAGVCRAAYRVGVVPAVRYDDYGVRLVCVRVSPQLDP